MQGCSRLKANRSLGTSSAEGIRVTPRQPSFNYLGKYHRHRMGQPRQAGRPFENTTLLGQGLYVLGSINHPGCSRATSRSEPSGVVAGVEGCAGCSVVWAKAPDANANAETKVTATIRERISALLRNPPFCNVQTIGGRQPRT